MQILVFVDGPDRASWLIGIKVLQWGIMSSGPCTAADRQDRFIDHGPVDRYFIQAV